MIKKTYNDNLFVYLDWILKKKGKEPSCDENIPYSYITNRWLSMVDPIIAQIVNQTTNRWIKISDISSNKTFISRFYRNVLPKMFKKYSYIKKSQEKKDTEEYLNFARVLELSSREIEIYEKTLAELKNTIK